MCLTKTRSNIVIITSTETALWVVSVNISATGVMPNRIHKGIRILQLHQLLYSSPLVSVRRTYITRNIWNDLSPSYRAPKIHRHAKTMFCLCHFHWRSTVRKLKTGSTTGPNRWAFCPLSPIIYLKTEAESSFRNVVVLLFYNLDDGKSPKEEIYIL
jgi:hypothetical protein